MGRPIPVKTYNSLGLKQQQMIMKQKQCVLVAHNPYYTSSCHGIKTVDELFQGWHIGGILPITDMPILICHNRYIVR